MTPTPLNNGLPNAYLSRGTYKGVEYELVVVDKENSAGLLGHSVGTSTGKFKNWSKAVIEDTVAPLDMYARVPKQIYFAANTTQRGWFRGVQFQDGHLVQDFETNPYVNKKGEPSEPRGFQVLGAKKDGTTQIYTTPYFGSSDSSAKMLADGVVNSFSFTFALVENGVKRQPDTEWRDKVENYDRMFKWISARTVLGSDSRGRVMLLVTKGKSKKSGLFMNEIADLAYSLGFHNAQNLDGGGSAQMLVEGQMVHPSSDDLGYRKLPDWGYIDGVNVVDLRTIGAIGAHYQANGGSERFGRPLRNEEDFEGGRVQRFQLANGHTTGFYWTEATGAHFINERGAFRAKWLQTGVKKLGFPTMDESPFWEGAKLTFQDGTVMYWSEATGAHSMYSRGGIFHRWARDGDVKKHGFPVTDETAINSECAEVVFSKNGYRTAIVWSARFGTYTFNRNGDFYARWKSNIKKYGYPVTDETGLGGGRAEQRFSNGYRFYWNGRYTTESRV